MKFVSAFRFFLLSFAILQETSADPLLNAVGGLVGGLLGGLSNTVNGIVGGLSNTTNGLIGGLSNVTNGLVGGVVGLLDQLLGKVIGPLVNEVIGGLEIKLTTTPNGTCTAQIVASTVNELLIKLHYRPCTDHAQCADLGIQKCGPIAALGLPENTFCLWA